jgi:hypothetical protein
MTVKRHIVLGFVGGFVLMANAAVAEDELFSASDEERAADSETSMDADSGGGGGDGLKFGGPLLLSKFTMEAGGAITITPEVYIPKQGDSGGGGWFHFNPELGFFIIDKLELLFSFNLGVPFGDISAYNVDVGFALGARYFLDFDVIALYMGGMLGTHFVVPDNVNLRVEKYFDINVLVGILIPMNRHIGIDVGMRFNTAILMGDYPRQNPVSTISFPIGYFGVDGFFNLFSGE